MPLQILPQDPYWGQGGSIGASFGAGLGEGLRELANFKMQQYQQRQQANRTANALEQYGLPHEKAVAVSQLPDVMQQAFFKDYLQSNYRSSFSQGLGKLAGNQPQGLEQLFSQMRPEDAFKLMQLQEQQRAHQEMEQYHKERIGVQKGGLNLRERTAAIEENKPFRTTLDESLKLANDLQADLPNLQKYVQKGQLDTGLRSLFPNWNPFSATDTAGFQNQVEEVIGKITGGLEKHQADAIRAKFTSLARTEQGQKQILKDISRLIYIPKIRDQVRRELIEENDGNEPFNLAALVEQRAAPKIARLLEKIEGLQPVEGENVVAQAIREPVPEGNQPLGLGGNMQPPQGQGPQAGNMSDAVSNIGGQATQYLANRLNPATQLQELASGGAEVASGIAGAPGDILNLGLGLGNLATRNIPYVPTIPTYETVQGALPVSLPTSGQVKGAIEKIFPKGYLDPRSTLQKYTNMFLGEVAGAATLGKIPGVSKFFNMPIGKIIATSGVSNAVPAVAAGVGVGEKGQNFLKMATLLGPAVLDFTRLGKAATTLKNTALKNAEKIEIPASKIYRAHDNIYTLVDKAERSVTRDDLFDTLSNIALDLEQGDAARAKDVLDSINKLDVFAKDPTTSKRMVAYAEKAKNDFVKVLEDSNAKGVIEPYKQALDIEAGLKESSRLRQWIDQSLDSSFKKVLSGGTLGLLGMAIPGSYATKAAIGAGLTAVPFAATSGEYLVRLMSHPGVQKQLGNVLVAAAKRRVPELAHQVSKLDKITRSLR